MEPNKTFQCQCHVIHRTSKRKKSVILLEMPPTHQLPHKKNAHHSYQVMFMRKKLFIGFWKTHFESDTYYALLNVVIHIIYLDRYNLWGTFETLSLLICDEIYSVSKYITFIINSCWIINFIFFHYFIIRV